MSDDSPSTDIEDDESEAPARKPDKALDVDWDLAGGSNGDAAMAGAELIADCVKRLPNSPGVYRMFNQAGDVLYVGKAKSLKKRVSSYGRQGGHTNRIARMIQQTATMEFVTTRTETEALLLEANLIKRLRPRYNVLLRDDKSFPYIRLTASHNAPGIFKHRGARAKQDEYFGPFASAGSVSRTINALQRAFLLRTCTDSVFEGRTRPCLLYQIKRCAGPCTNEIAPEHYAALVDEARDFLRGRSQAVKTTISKAMEAASQELDFERAAIYRDRLAALSHVQSHQGINPQGVDEADVFALYYEGGQFCVEVFFFRTGQNWGNRAYFPRADASMDAPEVLEAFITQFYDGKPIPKLILTSHELPEQALMEEAFATAAHYKVEIRAPQRGEKRDLVAHVMANAKEALGRRMAETSTQKKLLGQLAETFDLPAPPRRIEVYDNSHIMGTNAVGGMIVAGPDGFSKAHYRKFNIKSKDITPGDDFGMMREVLERRFSRLLKEHGLRGEETGGEDADPSAMPEWPDLLLIDGGIGQYNAVKKVLTELGIEDQIAMVGVAKGVDRDAGRERFITANKPEFSLPPRDPVLYFIQRMRDEAHRFAIGTHRAKRKKEMVKNPLDEIGGIGPTRKRALLHHFGTAKAISRAAMDDLLQVEGISAAMAKIIYDHFHENP